MPFAHLILKSMSQVGGVFFLIMVGKGLGGSALAKAMAEHGVHDAAWDGRSGTLQRRRDMNSCLARARGILARSIMAQVLPLLTLVLATLVTSATAAQVTETWTGGVGDWNNDVAMWDPPVCPGTCPPNALSYPRNGFPDAATTYAIQIDDGNAANSVITLDVGISIDTLAVDAGDQFTLANGHFLRIDGGAVTNNGIILLNSSGNSTKFAGFSADLTLGGAGTMVMSDVPHGFGNRIKTDSGHRVTNAAGHTIRGPGNFGDSAGPLTNHGVIDGDSPSGNTLEVFPSSDDMINTGTMQASNGGILQLHGETGRTFTNTGGLIQALDGSVVELLVAEIIGGTLSTSGTGVIRSLSGTLDGVTIASNVEVPNARQLALKGTVTNNGNIALNATTTSARLGYVDDATLTGTGTVTMSDDLGNQVRALAAGLRLTHGAGHTIQGAGDIGQNNGPLTNLGAIIANRPTRLEIDVSAVETFTNQGTLQADAGSTLNVIDNFNNTGMIVVGGTLKIGTGSNPTGTVTQNAGGSLSGGGTVQGNLVNGGEVNPGASAGMLTVTRDFTQQSGGALNIQLGGMGDSEFDQLIVTETASLAGTLNVTLIDGFVPDAGETFEVLTFASRTGDFTTMNLDLGQGRYATAAYRATALTLTIHALDHYLCYTVKTTPGTPKFERPAPVTLKDQFEEVTAEVLKPVSLCTPVDKNAEGIVDQATHLEGYQIKQPKAARVRGLEVENQFNPVLNGVLVVNTTQPDRLLVPTAKSLASEPPAPNPAAHEVDHYKCYKVREDKASEFAPIKSVSLKDQFIEVQLGGSSKLFDLKKPTRLCNPVEKNGEEIKHRVNHLMCYQVKAVRAVCADGAPQNEGDACKKEEDCGGTTGATNLCVRQPKHAPVTSVQVNNQFGPEQLDTIKEEELCVPSTKILP